MKYLRTHLLPLMEEIKSRSTPSHTMECFGMDDVMSISSFQIQMGFKFEAFWNLVIQKHADSLITVSDRILVGTRERQMDMCFVRNNIVYYLECKSNVNFDSEKVRASNEKVQQITQLLKEQHAGKTLVSGYFMPNVLQVPRRYVTKYTNKGINIYGVQWLHNILQCTDFTTNEYFTFLRTEGKQLVKRKLNIV